MVFDTSHIYYRQVVACQIGSDRNSLSFNENIFPVFEENVGTNLQTIVEEVDINTIVLLQSCFPTDIWITDTTFNCSFYHVAIIKTEIVAILVSVPVIFFTG